jgi:hypothetical protein
MYRQKKTRMCERAEEGENKLARTNDVGFGRKRGTTVQRLQAVAIEDLEKDKQFTDLGCQASTAPTEASNLCVTTTAHRFKQVLDSLPLLF